MKESINKEIVKKIMLKLPYIEKDEFSTFSKILHNGDLLFSTENVMPEKIVPITSIILTRKFARRFWGDKKIGEITFNGKESYTKELLAWQYHLQKMVLYKNPLKYLIKFLPK